MLFNSPVFLFLFLPLAVGGFFALARVPRGGQRLAIGWAALASLVFYGWWDARYVALLVGSIVFNYACGIALARRAAAGHPSRLLLAFAVGANLLLLGIFKYTDFLVGTWNAASGASVPLLQIVLPLGISFFTFTQIAFLVDAHRGIAREYDFIYYLLFVTWFPHLIAGPVLHHKEMMPQFYDPSTLTPRRSHFEVGLTIFFIGLFKKVVLADGIAEHVGPVFNSTEAPTLFEAWSGALAYTFQLYFDFSGYSDMAIGLSRLFGVKLPLNFASPYQSASIIEFWRRCVFICLASPVVSLDFYKGILGLYQDDWLKGGVSDIFSIRVARSHWSDDLIRRISVLLQALDESLSKEKGGSMGGVGAGKLLLFFLNLFAVLNSKGTSRSALCKNLAQRFYQVFEDIQSSPDRADNLARLSQRVRSLMSGEAENIGAYMDEWFVDFMGRYFLRDFSPAFLHFMDGIYKSIPEAERIGWDGQGIINYPADVE